MITPQEYEEAQLRLDELIRKENMTEEESQEFDKLSNQIIEYEDAHITIDNANCEICGKEIDEVTHITDFSRALCKTCNDNVQSDE